ncbi:MAG: chemotaxis protein [Gammaproteobacteria bacterium]|nr:chemotaxis protein [Gammaproteobacteria bacterium]
MSENPSRNVLNEVDARTGLVGQSRLELLLFRLHGSQRYGINVFKVREVVSCQELTRMPGGHPAVLGLANMRGITFMVVDLKLALGMPENTELSTSSIIVSEYNRKIQGFLVPKIEHIINMHWEDILPPPKMVGNDHYLTAITRVDDELVEILDVEKVLYEITGAAGDELAASNPGTEDEEFQAIASRCHVLVADDSSVARNQVTRTLNQLGLSYTVCNDGRLALDQLELWAKEDSEELKRLAIVISDVEMPAMDGYTLTGEIRKNQALSGLIVLLHTSLSGVFDSSLLEKVNADGFLSKFDSDDLIIEIKQRILDFVPKLEERGL